MNIWDKQWLQLSQRLVAGVVVLLICIGCTNDADESQKVSTEASMANVGKHTLTVYKTPSCSCCGAWVEHVKQSGFGADVVNQDTVAHIKDHYGLPAAARSCHTAVSDNNFVFEGHVPAKYIAKFLDAPMAGTKGLIVPAMPLGSPGMEVDDKFQPYQIFALKENGGLVVFAEVDSYAQQF